MAIGYGWHMRTRLILAGCLLLTGCDLAPAYVVPETPQPAAFKETGPWVRGTVPEALPHQDWWKLYGDTRLDDLEGRIATANPTLAQAQARYDAARGYLGQAQSSVLPTLAIGGHADTNKQSANRPLRSPNQPTYYGDDMAGAGVSWDIDLWGRIRNTIVVGGDEA